MSNVQITKNTPQIRFKGFDEEWNLNSLGECVEFYSGLTYTPNDVVDFGGTLVLRSSNVQNGELDFEDNVYVDDNAVNSDNVEKGDIIVVVRNGSRALIGKHAVIKQEMKKTVIGAFMTGVKTEEPNFYNALFSSPKFSEEIEKDLGATINQITTGSFSRMTFKFPSSTEQTKIGELFSRIDSLIASTQKEHDKLVSLKKCMLQKMFPKKGSLVPEIRFKGFSGDWEETSAENIFITTNDRNHAGLPVLSASQEFGMIYRDEGGMNISHDKANEVTYKRVLPGQFVIHLRSFQGGFAHSKVEGITSPAYTIMDFSDKAKHDDYFWKYIFSSTEFINRLELITYGIRDGRSINFSDFSKLTFFIPNKREQEKIGTYFRNLDSLIYKQKDELEKLKNVKKTLLSKMFV